MLSMAGGDAFPFTTLPKGAGDPKWSPDGKMIVFHELDQSARILKKQEKKKRKEEELKRLAASRGLAFAGQRWRQEKPKPDDPAKTAEAETERESDVQVVTRAVYRSNNEGYLRLQAAATHLGHAGAAKRRRESAAETADAAAASTKTSAIWSKDSTPDLFRFAAQ